MVPKLGYIWYHLALSYHLGHGPEGSDGVDVEAVLLLADRGEPFLHPRHMSLLVRFPKSCIQYSTVHDKVQHSTVYSTVLW